MVIPYNPNFLWDGTSYYGTSLTSFTELARKLGYTLLGTDLKGVNAFFIQKNLVILSGFQDLTLEQGYHLPSHNNGPLGGHPWKDGPILKI